MQNNVKTTTVLDDIKESKGYILGVIAFATAVAGFLTQVVGFRPEPTIASVTGLTVFTLFLSWLISRSEKRQESRMQEHQEWADSFIAGYDAKLDQILDMQRENQLATLRIEMGNAIVRHPDNHDTILKYAEKYFVELGGDWVMTDIFYDWVEKEGKEGRSVRVPSSLLNDVQTKRMLESRIEK